MEWLRHHIVPSLSTSEDDQGTARRDMAEIVQKNEKNNLRGRVSLLSPGLDKQAPHLL